ncbi:MAG: signal peptidase II [Actinomycetota bacterium]|nr:signal peptidase II [Actinomycetota bacterium]
MHQLQESRRAAVIPSRKYLRAFLATAAFIVALDRISKLWAEQQLAGGKRIALIGRFLGLSLVHNPGGAFGTFPGASLFLFIASVAIVGVVIRWAWKGTASPYALGLVLGGGLGNVIDRMVNAPGIMRGRVTDFIDVSFWPTFNFADSAIVVGIVLILLSNKRRSAKAADETGADDAKLSD